MLFLPASDNDDPVQKLPEAFAIAKFKPSVRSFRNGLPNEALAETGPAGREQFETKLIPSTKSCYVERPPALDASTDQLRGHNDRTIRLSEDSAELSLESTRLVGGERKDI